MIRPIIIFLLTVTAIVTTVLFIRYTNSTKESTQLHSSIFHFEKKGYIEVDGTKYFHPITPNTNDTNNNTPERIDTESSKNDWSLRFDIRTGETAGLIMMMGYPSESLGKGSNYFSIWLINGRITYTASRDSKTVRISSSHVLKTRVWHTVYIERYGNSIKLFVDNEQSSREDNIAMAAISPSTIFIGGKTVETIDVSNPNKKPTQTFVGIEACLRQIFFNNTLLSVSHPVGNVKTTCWR